MAHVGPLSRNFRVGLGFSAGLGFRVKFRQWLMLGS